MVVAGDGSGRGWLGRRFLFTLPSAGVELVVLVCFVLVFCFFSSISLLVFCVL